MFVFEALSKRSGTNLRNLIIVKEEHVETHVSSQGLSQALSTTIINSILAKVDSLKTVSYQINFVTYPQLFLIFNALRQRVNDAIAELILTNIKVFQTLVATKVREESTQRLFIPDRVVLKCERLELGELSKLLRKLDDRFVRQLLVADAELVATT